MKPSYDDEITKELEGLDQSIRLSLNRKQK